MTDESSEQTWLVDWSGDAVEASLTIPKTKSKAQAQGIIDRVMNELTEALNRHLTPGSVPEGFAHSWFYSYSVIHNLGRYEVRNAIQAAQDAIRDSDGQFDWTTFESRIVLDVDTREGGAPGLKSPTGLVAMARVRWNGETA